MTATPVSQDETVRKINRTVIKYVTIRLVAGVGMAVAGTLIANALDKKLNDDTETTEDN